MTYNTQTVKYHVSRLDEPVFIPVPKPLLTEFGIHERSEICVSLSNFNLLMQSYVLLLIALVLW